MERKHSWTWLPSRLTNLQPSDHKSPSPKRRPPIAELQQLEDRVLLSASSDGGGTDAILIGLLKSQVDIRSSTVNFLKVVEGVNDGSQAQADAFWKITDSFLKIDAAVAKLTTDALFTPGHKADAVGQKANEDKVQESISLNFTKIDLALGAFGDGSVDKLLPAVQKIQESTNAYVSGLANLPAVQFKDHKELGGFLKIQQDLLKVDVILNTAAKIHDITISKPLDKSSTQLMLKLDTDFQKIDSAIIAVFGDGSVSKALQSDVDAYKAQTEELLPAILPPPTTTPGTTALSTINTSDTIS